MALGKLVVWSHASLKMSHFTSLMRIRLFAVESEKVVEMEMEFSSAPTVGILGPCKKW